MRPSEVTIDLIKFNKLKAPVKHNNEMFLNINETRNVTLNGILFNTLKDAKGWVHIDIFASDDYKTIALISTENSTYVFNKSRSLKANEFAYELEKRGYPIPAKYLVEWTENANCYVGLLQIVAAAPKISRRKKVEK